MWPAILMVILGFTFVPSIVRSQTRASKSDESTTEGTKKTKKAPAETKDAATSAEASDQKTESAAEKSSTTAIKTSAKENPFAPPPSKWIAWINLNNQLYHVGGEQYFGKTKNGKQMTLEDAKKTGYRETKAVSKLVNQNPN
jgi:hypothetical protein